MLVHYLRKKYILIMLHLLVLSSEGHRKSKKARDLKISPPKYEIYSSSSLPSDVQITKYLLKGNQEIFSYWSALVINGTISVSVIPCSSLIQWNFIYIGDNKTGRSYDENRTFETNNFTTKMFHSQDGLYLLSLKAIERDTYINIYISTEIGGPQTLRSSHLKKNFRIHLKQKRKSASLKWNPSLVDPQSTDYCLVISTSNNFNSLCSAQAARQELPPPRRQIILQKPLSESQTIIKYEPTSDKYVADRVDPMIACTGKKLHYTILNLKEGQMYYYDLFAINKQSNLTYPYGSITSIFKSQSNPLSLKNGYGQANLKKLGDRAVFRYKIGRNVKDNLDLFIIPCGGLVDVKIMLKRDTVAVSRKIEGFRKITLKYPKRGERYMIKVLINKTEDSRRTSAVEVYASNKALSKIPMITEPRLEEYISMRGCHSVTIGWILVPDQRMLHYCVETKEGRLKDMGEYKIQNQCGLENRLRKSLDFVTKYCEDIKQENRTVYTHTIQKLKPGRHYIVQLTVKKPKGKTLSYDLLQVNTKNCKKHHN